MSCHPIARRTVKIRVGSIDTAQLSVYCAATQRHSISKHTLCAIVNVKAKRQKTYVCAYNHVYCVHVCIIIVGLSLNCKNCTVALFSS